MRGSLQAEHAPPGAVDHDPLRHFVRVRGPAAPRRRSLLRCAARSLPRRPPAYGLSRAAYVHRDAIGIGIGVKGQRPFGTKCRPAQRASRS